MSSISRRTFIRSAAAGTSVVALAQSGVARGFPANEKVQLGWLGVGGRGSHLLRTIVKHAPDARIIAVCELRENRGRLGQKIVEQAGQPRPKYYKDMYQMMDKEKMDGIAAITAPSDHAGVVVPILQRDYHTFSEKPLDTTVERVDAIVKAARKSKGFLQVGTQRRYNPGYISGIKVIHSGQIGKVTFIQGHWHWPWRTTMRIDTHGGELVEQAVHHTDVASWVMNNQAPHTCVSMGYQQFKRPGGPNVWTETHSATSWMFPGGVIFSYTHLFYLPEYYTSEKMWVFCEKAGVDLRLGMMHTVDKRNVRVGESSGTNWDKGTIEELQDFVDNIKTGGKRVPNANVETARVATLMAIMGRMAMRNPEKNIFEPRIIRWKDLGTTTDL